jgi:tetraacyldisaccharide 4'-kinase
VPVLSIGNLHLGGTGKTPLVAAVARHLEHRGRRVAVLSRGYRRRSSGVQVVSRGAGLEIEASAAGDEPALLAAHLPGVAVLVGESRYQAGLHALKVLEPAPDLFVLDDGFAHVGLARDVDLLAFPHADPWGNARLAPAGPLREPLAAARHAHGLLVTGLTAPNPARVDEIVAALRPLGFAGPGFGCLLGAVAPEAASSRALLVTGVARPERVLATARELGVDVAEHLRFPDHHDYPAKSLERIARTFHELSAKVVLTTQKDAVKLTGRLTLPLETLDVRALPEEGFWQWLDYSSPISKSGSPPSTD